MPQPQSIDDLRTLERLIGGLEPDTRAKVAAMAAPALAARFTPLPGQQALAYDSPADVLG